MTDVISIVGGKPLSGGITISGSKNGALPTLAAGLLMEGECRLHNIPQIADVETMLALLRCCGAQIRREGPDTLLIDARNLRQGEVPEELAGKMRASYYVLAPLAARLGQARLPLPGGCDLGSRPVDFILRALEAIGLTAAVDDGWLSIRGGPAKGGRVVLDPLYCSPGATFTVIMAACLGRGETVIKNACAEPDVVSLCEFLGRAGAKIQGVGTPTIRVQGVSRLRGVEHSVPGDRLEAGTYLLIGAASRGDVTALGIKREHLLGLVEAMEQSGVEVTAGPDGVRARCPRRPKAVDIVTRPFPGFPTDLQPMMMAFLASAEGTSHLEETIFDGRMGHVKELWRMGAVIEAEERKATVHGVARLRGAEVEALNIRAGAALVVAAVGAAGETTIRNPEHLRRGYERLEEKLAALGADIRARR